MLTFFLFSLRARKGGGMVPKCRHQSGSFYLALALSVWEPNVAKGRPGIVTERVRLAQGLFAESRQYIMAVI